MKYTKAAASESLRPAMLTEKELISKEPQFKDLKPGKTIALIEFIYELSLILYNSHVNSRDLEAGQA